MSNQLNRRTFLKLSGLGLLATSLPLGITACARPEAMALPRLSVQLYTVRNQIEEDLRGTLRRLAEIGFTHVETAFWPDGVSHSEGAAFLRDAGLMVSSIHAELPENGGRELLPELAELYQCDRLIWHGWPEDPRYQTVDGTLELASVYNELFRYLKDNGLRFGLHNHWWEFRTLPNGETPWQILHRELDEEIFSQLDIYWVAVAGLNPSEVIRELGNRVEMLHVKDGPANPDDLSADEPHEPMTAVGEGTLDIPSVMDASSGTAEWMVLEMDEADGDVFALLEESCNYMLENGFAVV